MGNKKQRTFIKDNKKVKLVSEFKGFLTGFHVTINGQRFFNTGENGTRLEDFTSPDEWRESMRLTAEERCIDDWIEWESE